MSKFYGYDEAMENDIAKITTPKLALMSDVVASDKKFIRMENGALTVIAGVLIAVGNSVFKTEKTTLTASNLDGTASKFEVGKDYCIYICDPTGGDATNFAAEQYRISLNTTYPNGYTKPSTNANPLPSMILKVLCVIRSALLIENVFGATI